MVRGQCTNNLSPTFKNEECPTGHSQIPSTGTKHQIQPWSLDPEGERRERGVFLFVSSYCRESNTQFLSLKEAYPTGSVLSPVRTHWDSDSTLVIYKLNEETILLYSGGRKVVGGGGATYHKILDSNYYSVVELFLFQYINR